MQWRCAAQQKRVQINTHRSLSMLDAEGADTSSPDLALAEGLIDAPTELSDTQKLDK